MCLSACRLRKSSRRTAPGVVTWWRDVTVWRSRPASLGMWPHTCMVRKSLVYEWSENMSILCDQRAVVQKV